MQGCNPIAGYIKVDPLPYKPRLRLRGFLNTSSALDQYKEEKKVATPVTKAAKAEPKPLPTVKIDQRSKSMMHERPGAGLPSITTVQRNESLAKAAPRKQVLKLNKQGWNMLKVTHEEPAATTQNVPMYKNKTAEQGDCETRKSALELRTFDPATNRSKIIAREVEIDKPEDFHDDFLKTLGCESAADFLSPEKHTPRKFAIQKGYTQRIVDQGKAHLRASMWPMLRDGNAFY